MTMIRNSFKPAIEVRIGGCMTFKYLRKQAIAMILACASGQAVASVELRVESRPMTQPINAYVLATDGSTSIEGLDAADFSIALDGSPLDEFDLVLPPRQDPSQQVSVVVIMGVTQAPDNVPVFEELQLGDYVSIAKIWANPESPRFYGGIDVMPFTQVDGGAGSNALIQFMQDLPEDYLLFTPRKHLFDGLVAGLTELQAPPVSLPDGPKAIVTLLTSYGSFLSPSLSDIAALANANSIPIFNATYPFWDLDSVEIVRSTALASATGGVQISVADEEGAGDAIARMAFWLENGYRITIPASAVGDCNPHMLEVTVRGEVMSAPFVRCDTTPERFGFGRLEDAPVGTLVVSNPVVLQGFEAPVPMTIQGGEYSIGCGSSFTSEPGLILPGESVCVRHTTAASGGREVYTALTAEGETGWFESSTLFEAPPPPPPLSAGNGGGGRSGAGELVALLLLLVAGRCRGKRLRLAPGGALDNCPGLN